jgi:uncharacterized lipoprotein YmbA
MLLASLALGGCATAPSSFYTLTALPDATNHNVPRSDKGLAIGVGPVRFPEFLDRPQIVSRSGANRLALDEYHRWGGSLQDDFLRIVGENLGQLLGTSRILVGPAEARFPLDFRVIADVLSFEGAPSGEAVFKVRWAVLDPYLDQALVVGENTYRSRAESRDPEAMIAALSETVAAFSRDLADRLRSLPKTQPLAAYVEPL